MSFVDMWTRDNDQKFDYESTNRGLSHLLRST